MKILVITSERTTGLNYHRQIAPFSNLDIEIHACQKWDDNFTDDFLKDFSCVSFLRTIDLKGNTKIIVDRIHKLGLKIHFDIDDYWLLPSSHPLYKGYKDGKVQEQVIEALTLSDFITTTTKHLAIRIEEYNKNVYVLRNAINPEEEQWQIEDIKNDKLRFGYIAGVHHNKDVELMHENIHKVFKDRTILDKYQFSVAGFNINIYPDGTKRMNAYYKYVEQLFTKDYKLIKDKEYKEYLLSNAPEGNELTFDKEYRRLWGLDCFKYGKLYNLIDVSLVPLKQNMFSACKSELKLIEAGFMKKAVIVSNVKPYNILADSTNALLVNGNRNEIDWFINIRKMINEPNLREDLTEQLHEDVKDKYHIKNVNVERKQIFEEWLK